MPNMPKRFRPTNPFPAPKRESAAKRGYDGKWRMIRAQFLGAHPSCPCGAPATEVDHIIALARGGSNAWANLQALCGPCHRRKTISVDGGFGFGSTPKGGGGLKSFTPEE